MTTGHRLLAAEEGCYEAPRAAALSGVPLSTVYQWARTDLVVPSISPSREMLWSYADLMTLRLVAWLRRPKRPDDTRSVRGSPMSQVRRALVLMNEREIDPWSGGVGSPSILVDARGTILLQEAQILDLDRQVMLDLPEDTLDLLRPFTLGTSPGGPDLVRPRPALRIVPAKVAGEPHVADTRITSRTLSALVRRGVPVATVSQWYGVAEGAVSDAADLEDQLGGTRVAA